MQGQTQQPQDFTEHFTLPVEGHTLSCDLERRTTPAGEACYALSVHEKDHPLGDYKLIPIGSGRYGFIGNVPDYLKKSEDLVNKYIAHDTWFSQHKPKYLH